MKKHIFVIFLAFILLIFVYSIYLKSIHTESDNTVLNSLPQTLLNQQKENEKPEKIYNDDSIKFSNPMVIVNPYNISPLTALIFFNTLEEEVVEIYINDAYATKFPKSKKHVIPIYGLFEDYENKIKIGLSSEEENTIKINTEGFENIEKLNIIKSEVLSKNEMYFFAGPMKTGISAYDPDGNLRWFLTEPYSMDVEWLDNGHFLIGINENSISDRKIGFVEMDYLGKIYNYYILEHGYEFEFQKLDNGNYMLAGGNKPIFYDSPYVYELNPKSGKTVSYIDIKKIIKDIDPNFDHILNWTIIRNSFALNEKNNELIISLRGLNSIICIDYKTQKLKWIFSDEEIWNDNFKDYMLELESGRYPMGQHGIIITKEGYIGFINNGYD